MTAAWIPLLILAVAAAGCRGATPLPGATTPTSALVMDSATALGAQQSDSARGARRARECPPCAEWNAPQKPLRLHGNTYYVGTHGLSAILLTSDRGHVLVDAGLPESAPLIRASIEALGFRMNDVKLIVNSHAHYDHAGGLAALQRASGATIAASRASAPVLMRGASGPDDPQYGVLIDFPPVSAVQEFAFGDTLRVGPWALVPHATPGHTAGGTSWTWRSCEGAHCLDFVYADSQTPVSANGFFYTRSRTYPTALADFARGHAALEALRCDVLITPHPAASNLWQRVSPSDGARSPAFVDATGCRRYADGARGAVARRVAAETSGR